MARLLILSSDTGEGHNSAAVAIRDAALDSGWDVSLRKPSEESATAYRSLNHVYNTLLTYRPDWVRMLTGLIDRLRPNELDFFYRRVRDYIERLVLSESPDLILSVHPMLNHMIQRWVQERAMDIRCYTFVTDPFPPFWKGWSSPYIDRYFVLTDEAAGELTSNGVDASRIESVRMPIRSGFRPLSSDAVAALRTELQVDGPVILINGGARGGGPVKHLVGAVRDVAPNLDLLVVCGHNRSLRRQLDQRADPRLRTFGFVDDMHLLVGAADLVITKPGALSTYESLASGVPSVLTAVGGLMPQESGLFQAATRYGFGFAVRSLDELRAVVSKGVDEWRQKRDAIARFYPPDSGAHLMERIQPLHVQG